MLVPWRGNLGDNIVRYFKVEKRGRPWRLLREHATRDVLMSGYSAMTLSRKIFK